MHKACKTVKDTYTEYIKKQSKGATFFTLKDHNLPVGLKICDTALRSSCKVIFWISLTSTFL